jgi:hypothetical protein
MTTMSVATSIALQVRDAGRRIGSLPIESGRRCIETSAALFSPALKWGAGIRRPVRLRQKPAPPVEKGGLVTNRERLSVY